MFWEEESAGNKVYFKYNHLGGPSTKIPSKHTLEGLGYSSDTGAHQS